MFFKKAKPIWISNEENVKNILVSFQAVIN